MRHRIGLVISCVCMVAALATLAPLGYAAEPPKDTYPIDTCIVSGEKLGGSMGDPVIFDYKGREIRFCCPACKPKFEANPDEYLKKLDVAIIEKQGPTYPLDYCVVLGTKFDEKTKPVNYIYKNRLVRFCCKDCIAQFEKDPQKYLKIIDDAAAAKSKKG